MLRYLARMKVEAGYTLYDMVDDTIALLDHLSIDKAHLIGESMGGMIAQLTTATHPKRVKSLTSIMRHTNRPWMQTKKEKTNTAHRVQKHTHHTDDEYKETDSEQLTNIGGKLPQGSLLDSMLAPQLTRRTY